MPGVGGAAVVIPHRSNRGGDASGTFVSGPTKARSSFPYSHSSGAKGKLSAPEPIPHLRASVLIFAPLINR